MVKSRVEAIVESVIQSDKCLASNKSQSDKPTTLYIRCIGSFIMIIDYRLSVPSIEVLEFWNPWSGKLTYNLVKFLAAAKIKLNNELASWDIAMSVYWIITRTKKQAQNAFFLHSPDGRPPPYHVINSSSPSPAFFLHTVTVLTSSFTLTCSWYRFHNPLSPDSQYTFHNVIAFSSLAS